MQMGTTLRTQYGLFVHGWSVVTSHKTWMWWLLSNGWHALVLLIFYRFASIVTGLGLCSADGSQG